MGVLVIPIALWLALIYDRINSPRLSRKRLKYEKEQNERLGIKNE